MGVAALVIGIVGLVFSFVPFLNILLLLAVITGLVLGIVDVVKKSKIEGAKKGVGIAGIVLNSVAIFSIIFAIIVTGLFAYGISSSGILDDLEDYYYDYYDDYDYDYDYDYNDYFNNYNYNFNSSDYDFDF